jgi:putative oxidoreductase
MINRMKIALARTFAVTQNSRSTDIALLLLRIMVTTSLFYHHGMDKIPDWELLKTRPYLNPIGIGVVPSLVFALITDTICAFLVLVGFGTRIASFFCLLTLGTVLFLIDHVLTTPYWPVPHGGHGEMLWVYTAAFLVFLIAGSGRYSLESRLPAPSVKLDSKSNAARN